MNSSKDGGRTIPVIIDNNKTLNLNGDKASTLGALFSNPMGDTNMNPTLIAHKRQFVHQHKAINYHTWPVSSTLNLDFSFWEPKLAI